MGSVAVSWPDPRAFLERLGARGVDADGSADLFAETFLSLDPADATLVTREQLRAALPKRAALFAAAGITATSLQSLAVRPLDDMHQLAETTWTAELDDPGADPLTLRSTYLLRLVDGDWSIVVYLNHDDVGAELARRAAR